MKFTVNVKPNKLKANTNREIMRLVRGSRGYSTSSEFGSGLTTVGRYGDNKVRVYNLHKVHRKVVQEKYKTGDKKGQTKKSKVIEKAHWIAYVYDFDIALLKMLKLEVRQNTRNFVIKPSKR